MAAAAREGEGEVRRDMWGQEYRTASGGCAAALDEHYAHTMSFGRGRGHAVLRAAAADPRCALASSLAAHHVAPRDPARAAAFLAAAADNLGAATEYERAVFRALSALIGEERDEQVAIERHFELLKEFPRDLMSLKRAQLICFYMGRPDTSLKFVEQVLPENQDQNYIYGMLAFPLLELGRMDDAEKAARKGLAINKNDCWLTHNWWHVAVCYLEGEFPTSKVLEIYDHNFMTELEKSDCEAAEVYLNALGLLLRLHIRGQVDLAKDRLAALLDALTNEKIWHVEWLLDLLVLWALSSMGEITRADNLLESLRSRVSSMDTKKQQVMQKAIQLAEAVYEYGKGEHKKVFDILGPDFDALSCKELMQFGLYTAIEVLEKQIRKREGAPFLWRLLEKAYSLHGRAADASVASEKANALQAAYSR
uniref:Tetratricopeptide repeat protein 38 n=1 Tax=Oryza sativa subsp. japonica TaxID=39947 RepID=Q10EY3_ORYSJ|nr:expressed protein [Oryza sativa Japonica Group]